MKKFNEFNLLRLFESLLRVEPQFYDILNTIPSGDTISDVLYDWISNKTDITTKYNMLSVDKKNSDKILFIPDNQYQRAIQQGQDTSNKTKSDSAIGRFARSIMKDNGIIVSDSQVEEFVNKYKKKWLELYEIPNFRIVKGEDILYWYLESNYLDGGLSTLGNSCMRYSSKNHYMKLYAENTETVSMAIMTRIVDGVEKLVARNLIWKISDGFYYCDRIYYNSDPLEPLMKQFLNDNIEGNKIFYSKGHVDEIKVELNNVLYEKYPYADSLYFIATKIVDGKLSNSGFIFSNKYFAEKYDEDLSKKYAIFKIQDTGGNPEYINVKYLSSYSKYYLNDDIIEFSGEYYPKEECVVSKYHNSRYIPKELAVWSEYIKDWLFKDRVIDHPEFGIIPDDYFLNVVTKYIGDKIYPWDIYEDINSDPNSKLEFKYIPKNSTGAISRSYYKSEHYKFFGDNDLFVYWSNKFSQPTEFDSWTSVSLFNVKIIKLKNAEGINKSFVFNGDYILKIDFKLLGLDESLILDEKTASIHTIFKLLNRINYEKTKQMINTSRKLTPREKKWRLSLLDWCGKKLRHNDVYNAYNKIENIDDMIDTLMRVHRDWYIRKFVNSDSYDNLINYIKRKAVGEIINGNNWSNGATPEIKSLISKYAPIMQFIWIFVDSSNDSKAKLKSNLDKYNKNDHNMLIDADLGGFDSIYDFLRNFLYYFQNNSRSNYYDSLSKEISWDDIDVIVPVMREILRNGEFYQINNYYTV